MQVSAVSTNSFSKVFNTKANNRSGDNYSETALCGNLYSDTVLENKNKLFDSINEWKYFCHAQIEKGNFDVII